MANINDWLINDRQSINMMTQKEQVIQAFAEQDIDRLNELLDDTKVYMGCWKDDFLGALEANFNSIRSSGIYAFEEILPGFCTSCGWGEGITFHSKGYCFDLHIVGDDVVEAIHLCDSMSNYKEIEREHNLFLFLFEDQEVSFVPDDNYLTLAEKYRQTKKRLDDLGVVKKVSDLMKILEEEDYLSVVGKMNLNYCRLYFDMKELGVFFEVIEAFETERKEAAAAVKAFRKTRSERDRIIWFFDHSNVSITNEFFILPETGEIPSVFPLTFIDYKVLDTSGYEDVMEYFGLHCQLYRYFLKRFNGNPFSAYGDENDILRLIDASREYPDIVEQYKNVVDDEWLRDLFDPE